MEEELKASYRKSLLTRINALEAARQAFSDQSATAEESIRRIAHSLRGSGTTYGFPEITKAADLVEHADSNELTRRLNEFIDLLKTISQGGEGGKGNILIIEDDADISNLLRIVLSSLKHDIFIAANKREAEDLIEKQDFILIILDLILPDIDGRNLIVQLRKRPQTATVPIIVLSGLTGIQPKTECLALGANAFFEKPFDPKFIAAAVSSELQRAEVQTLDSRIDPVTGLLNRAAFCESYTDMLNASMKRGEPLTFALLNIDQFKPIVEESGSATGQQVLQRVASVVGNSLRKPDIMARWGNDDFVIAFPGLQPNSVVQILELGLKALQSEMFRRPDQTEFRVTFSAGVIKITEMLSIEDACAKADCYLYLAKTKGKHRILSEETTESFSSKKLLLADDDDLIASVIRHRLRRENIEMQHVTDGEAALSTAAKSPFSLIILDVKMPVMDGFEVLENLRKLPEYENTPIIMLTSMGSERDIIRGFHLGANDYMLKPFSPVELIARIRRLLKGTS
ncbi:MAG: response regulator [Candidatus Omnitrophota bacterium]|jgi:diguanylate cyclase (GGDEF)-like protein|nr:MAG: response regulator [Candidatus Omnitrophota bacterium]